MSILSSPKISICIPNWNRASLLPATLDSFLNQTLKPYEIIVADDNSTDHYADVVAAYKDRVTFVKNEGHGPGAGRNSALKAATGDYIKFFDSDDLLTSNSLESQFKVLDNTGQGMVYSPYVHARQQENGQWVQVDPVLQYKPIPSESSIRKCMARGFFTIIPGMLFDRNFLKEVGFWRTDMLAYEDWDLLWRIGGLVPNPAHTNECCVVYRFHGAQTTGANETNRKRDRMKVSAFRDAETKVPKSAFGPKYGDWDRNLLRAQIRNTLQYLKDEPDYMHMYQAYNTPYIKLGSVALRLTNKLNRLMTRTDWQLYHGANPDPELFKHYVSLL